jgi:hypothetical protein
MMERSELESVEPRTLVASLGFGVGCVVGAALTVAVAAWGAEREPQQDGRLTKLAVARAEMLADTLPPGVLFFVVLARVGDTEEKDTAFVGNIKPPRLPKLLDHIKEITSRNRQP